VKRASVIAHIRHLCCLGLGAEAVMPALLRSLHDLVASESNAFFWVDQHDEITNFCAERILPAEVMRLYFREFYDHQDGGFRSTIRQTATRDHGIDRTTRESSFYQSDYYNLVWREHLHAHHVMYAVIHENGRRLGQLSLYRTSKDKEFTPTDEELLTRVTHYVAHAVAAGTKTNGKHGEYFDTKRVGMIILNARGETQHLSEEGKRLLFLASYPAISRQSLLGTENDAVPAALKQITQHLQAIFGGKDAPPPVWHIENCWGRFAFRAFWLDAERGTDPGLIGVTVQQQELLPLKLLGQLVDLGLSDQQKHVILMLADGASYSQIAEQLSITTNTANYHVKQIYDRMQVHNRNDLLNKVLLGTQPSTVGRA
jgi:DNA-binding CsgD family transcriptional regulator